jgi:CDP-4-dehydro-6-deoxyglucose reductase
MGVKWYEGRISRIENIASSVKHFWLTLDEAAKITFRSGQFVTMDLPIHEKRLKRWRSYSIASPPTEGGDTTLEFCIARLEQGLATSYLFEQATTETLIRLKGADGTFTLREPIEQDLVFICTGTGIAPFRSMILDIFNHNIPHKNIHLIFGTRTQEDILYQAELEALARQYPEFTFDVALSREPSDSAWLGYRGYVHQIYVAHYRVVRPDVKFYLCGWSKMIDEAVATLWQDLGYDKSQILYELYG